jgi:alpha-mannosidase
MVAGLLPILVPTILAGQTVKKFYIANDDHTDYMWSSDVAEYRTAFLQMLDYYLDLADTTASEPSEFQSRFSTDGTFWLWTYEKNKSKADFDRLISRLKSGHISAPMTLLNLCYGGMPAEAVLRSLYYAGKLERRFGLKFKLATCQENQALPYGVGALWAGAGASYSWKGICGCASQIPDAWNRPHDMYWWSGPDGSRLLMKWYSQIRQDGYGIGGYAEARQVPGIIDSADTDSDFLRRVPYGIVGLFGYGGDDLAAKTDVVIRTAKQATTSLRKVIVSNEIDFFEDFEKTYGSALPTLGASFGNEWDLLNASMAELSGSVKRGLEKLRAAEALAALVTAQDAQFMRGREDSRETAWIDLGMYFEHDWTADGSVSRSARAAWQRERASGFLTHVETLFSEAAAALGRLIRKDGSQRRFFVFNPLSFARTDAADLDYAPDGPVHVVDVAANAEVASQVIGSGPSRRLRIWVESVPSLGYKVYEIVPGAGRAFDGGPTISGDVLENGLYRLTIAPNGALAGLSDKTRGGREFVRAAAGLRMNELGPGSGTLSIVDAGPVSATLKAESTSPLAHNTFITLYRDSDRIDIRNEITQNFSALAQWTFGVNVSSPEVWHEEVGAVIKARPLDQGGLYANQALRRDWLTLNHFADMSGGGVGLTISSADNQFFKLGDSTGAFLDTATPKLSILAGGQVDGPGLGIPDQGGDSFFLQRFALRTHGAFDAAAAARFALEHQNPLVTGEVTGGTAYPAAAYSFLTIDDPNVVAWSVKPAEETSENRTIVRLWNLGSAPAQVSFAFGELTVLDAKRVSHIETPIENVAVQGNSVIAAIREKQWLTFSLALNGDSAAGKGIGRSKIR